MIKSRDDLVEIKSCACRQIKICFIYTTDDPGYTRAQMGVLKHLVRITSDEDEIKILDYSRQLTLHSLRKVLAFSQEIHPLDRFVSKTMKISLSTAGTGQVQNNDLGAEARSAIKSHMHSFFSDTRIPKNFLSKYVQNRIEKEAVFLQSALEVDLEASHFCVGVVLNGRHTHGRVAKESLKARNIGVLHWESSPTDEDRAYLCSHEPQNFWSYKQELTVFEPSKKDLEIAQTWVEDRSIDASPRNQYASQWGGPQKQGRAIPKVVNNSNLVSFFTSSQDELWALGSLFPDHLWKDQYRGLSRFIEDQTSCRDEIVIRMHPNSLNKSPRYVLEEISKIRNLMNLDRRVAVSLPTSPVNSYKLAASSRVILTSNSTIGVEALSLGIKVLHLNRSKYGASSEATLYGQSQGFGFQDLRSLATKEIALHLAHEHVKCPPEKLPKLPKVASVFSARGIRPLLLIYFSIRNRIFAKFFYVVFALSLRVRGQGSRLWSQLPVGF